MVCMWFVCGNFDVNINTRYMPNQKDPLTALQMDVVILTAFAQTRDYALVGILVF